MPSFDHSTYPDRIGFSFAKDTLDAYKAKREEMNQKTQVEETLQRLL